MSKRISLCLAMLGLAVSAVQAKAVAKAAAKVVKESNSEKPAVLWSDPGNIASRDLFYGEGGEKHAPGAGPFVFVEEDRQGNSPKFVVKDLNGVKWKVKLGAEARPETVVTRFVWAVGYATDEDYFLASQEVDNMPRLKRGRQFVTSDGIVHDARWERMDHKKAGIWKWSKNPFAKTRELNGLRVLMALFNNYDLKPEQNVIYEKSEKRQYLVGDLGATLGPTRSHWPLSTARGDLERYRRSSFIVKTTNSYVDFSTPAWPMMFGIIPALPLPSVIFRAPSPFEERHVGKHVPRDDVRWIAGLLREAFPGPEIRAAFRAADYSPEMVEAFSQVVERRIAQLNAI